MYSETSRIWIKSLTEKDMIVDKQKLDFFQISVWGGKLFLYPTGLRKDHKIANASHFFCLHVFRY